MSHFTQLKVKVTDRNRAMRVAQAMNWRTETVASYVNPYSSVERVQNALVFRDTRGTVKMVVDQQGNVIVDPYYMRNDYQTFLQGYAAAGIAEASIEEGGTVSETVKDQSGDLLVFVDF